MAFKFNPFTGQFDLDSGSTGATIQEVTTDPDTGTDGQMIINTTSALLKVWYGNFWQTVTALKYDAIILTQNGTSELLTENGNFVMVEV